MKTIAIGDVHGCHELLRDVISDCTNSQAEVVLLGDLFDRAPTIDGDRKVLDFVRRLQVAPEAYGLTDVKVLRGNHEQMLLDAYDTGDTELWEYNGGDPDFLEYLHKYPQYIEWIRTFPYYVIRGKYLLVHAGVRPDVPLFEQTEQDLMWYRRSDPSERHGLPYTVIHGHTPQNPPVVTHYPDAINLDTGAYATGVLSSILINYDEPNLQVDKRGSTYRYASPVGESN